ncbi:hypothetical protein D9758_017904 [Tetrapyrgos nigripes]|uniref:Glutaredoxin domain-containing protein n=1 Tax=Tetrapyrgos nigripes TaxID=182062 RepID=A0A8H5C0G8_9AGAR|nr:hypothetical protein D9758_017904 [Tetrapyrgos nigripes]
MEVRIGLEWTCGAGGGVGWDLPAMGIEGWALGTEGTHAAMYLGLREWVAKVFGGGFERRGIIAGLGLVLVLGLGGAGRRVGPHDAQVLTAAVAKFANAPAGDVQPQSKTNGVPQAAAAPQGETPAQLKSRMRSLMTQSKAVLFMKGIPDEPRCGFSRKIVGLLRDQGVEFNSFDILKDDGVRQVDIHDS